MVYKITEFTKRKAESLNVKIKLSTRKNKKIDVFKNGEKICSMGDFRYSDFPTYMRTHGKKYAEKRRRLYHLRHTSNGLASRFAKLLLW